MSRAKKKAQVMKTLLGTAFDKLPVHERRRETLARSRGRHSPYYIVKVLKRGAAAIKRLAA
jgi:hypothetical protein